MESASASIVIDVAELATEGMDSADEEPELRSAVQDLIQRLERIELRYRASNRAGLSAGLERPERMEEIMGARWYSSVRVEERVESAGASIVRDVAELATGGMDSAHEEPEGSCRYWSAGSSFRGMDSAHEEPEGSCRYWSAGSSFRGMDSAHEEQEGSSRYWSAGSSSGGMDSAHEEPEGSSRYSAVQDIIGCLEGKGKPITELPCLSRQEFRDFFPDRASISTISGWRSKVRREVLESIGSCNTFHYLDVNNIFGEDISRLEAKEWKVLLRGFSCSTVLRAIRVEGLRWKSIAEVESLESLCLQLGGILRTSSVTDLTIGNCRLSARCFLNLASGLGGNDESKLKTLELHNAWKDSDAVKPIADMINSATRLETLEIGGSPDDRMYDMDKEAARILSRALIQSSSLKKLVLREVEGETSAFLLKALHGDGGNRSIQCLHLISVSGLGDSLRELLTSNPYLKEVTLAAIRMRPEEWSRLGQAILENDTARSIRITHFIHHTDDLKGVDKLARAASSNVKEPKVELIIKFYDSDALMSALNFVGKVFRGEITSLVSLILYFNCSCPPDSNKNRIESTAPMDQNLEDTTVLKRLKLFVQRKETLKGVLKYLLGCLRDNTSVTQLDLSDSELDDEAFRDLMWLLQVNLTLKEIDFSRTSWETDGKATMIMQALEQNKKRADYMAVFREARLAFGDANAGRLFLCGSPLAGKTQLRQTLMRIVQGKSWGGDKLARLFRTTGIEVEFLQNNEKRQISIWDLAGQEVFRTLQNVLFPRTTSFCVFLFVYSTFCEKKKSSKPEYYFQIELEEWLSFITSCTKVTGHTLPQVLVVISHKDKVKSSSLTWAEPIVNELSKKFAKFVDLHPIEQYLHVDARSKKQVKPIKDKIFDMFDNLLTEKSPRVPLLCSKILSLLVTNTKENRDLPLWSFQKFQDFCEPIFAEFIPSYLAYSLDHSSKIMSTFRSYLNDVGSIVHIPNLDYIIVDPNWLTNTLLGGLIALGQNFQAQPSQSSDRKYLYTSKDGFVSESVFAQLIEEFLEKKSHVQRSVDRKLLENILINLDLCFKLEDTSLYFIPSFIPEHASMEEGSAVESMAWKTRSATSRFLGIRIQCLDARTMSLTAAFFPCFQMFMRRKLISEMGVPKEKVTCSRHYLCLFFGGHQIYVQQGTSHKYVDVLMLCSEDKSREYALKDVKKHIIQELISFCASPKGCPGVALVLGAIQTLCVEMLIPSHRRGAILIEELKSKFIHKVERLPLLDLKFEKEFFNYEHSWPLIEGHTTEVVYEKAMDLLCESDVEAVLNEIRYKRMQQLYVTNDVGLLYGVNASVHPRIGESVSLHWMCQSPTGFHMIKDQKGLRIRVDSWNSSWIWKIIEITSKFIYDAAKAGLDVTSGVGEAIPDRGDLKSDIVKLDGISDSDSRTELKGGESMELKEAWLRIQQTLAPQLRDSYSTVFKLYQVKYVRLELGGHAWVCEECMNKGFRSRILTC